MQNFLQNPYLIMSCQLIRATDDEKDSSGPVSNALLGTIVSSLYSLKDTDNSVGGFFVFGDLSVKCEGTYRLEFTLFELKMPDKWCWFLASVRSEPFTVYAQKYFPGMAESTFLTRSFSDQGVRLRLRKDSRSITTRKRNSTVADYPQRYSRHDHPQEVSPASARPDHHARSAAYDTMSPASMDRMDRVRLATAQSGQYFDNSPRLSEYSHGTPYTSYGGYDEPPRSSKRQRMVEATNGAHTYDHAHHDFTPYPHSAAGPRTIPEMPSTTSIMPYSTGYAVSSGAAVAALPMPAPYSHIPPRLDTQIPHSTGPSSAASTFSPGTQRRSPNSAYSYYNGAYTSTPTSMHYPAAVATTSMGHTNGLDLGLDLGDDKGMHVHTGL
ncbi:hypothetical protein DL546_009756 [Coniochaeta pulveracea]|uniref:Velvet domain-containing protein n=1 Tax=Coniochaeta pulveracea TaxID=177199 RepID=A0A420YN01_9PEZI|nr:hypothetical protein DL546_009756 [Coniochaeta pulveracea]